MTINEAYSLRATVTLTYIPVMTPGLYDTFPWPPETFPGHIKWFPGPFLIKILIFYISSYFLGHWSPTLHIYYIVNIWDPQTCFLDLLTLFLGTLVHLPDYS